MVFRGQLRNVCIWFFNSIHVTYAYTHSWRSFIHASYYNELAIECALGRGVIRWNNQPAILIALSFLEHSGNYSIFFNINRVAECSFHVINTILSFIPSTSKVLFSEAYTAVEEPILGKQIAGIVRKWKQIIWVEHIKNQL